MKKQQPNVRLEGLGAVAGVFLVGSLAGAIIVALMFRGSRDIPPLDPPPNPSSAHIVRPESYSPKTAIRKDVIDKPSVAVDEIAKLARLRDQPADDKTKKRLEELRSFASGNLVLEIRLARLDAELQLSKNGYLQDKQNALNNLSQKCRELQEWSLVQNASVTLELAEFARISDQTEAANEYLDSVLNVCESAMDPFRSTLSPEATREISQVYQQAVVNWASWNADVDGPPRYFAPGTLSDWAERYPGKSLGRIVPMPFQVGQARKNCISLMQAMLADGEVEDQQKPAFDEVLRFLETTIRENEVKERQSFLETRSKDRRVRIP